MAIFRRREKARSAADYGVDELDLDAVTATVLDAAQAATGARPAVTEGPAPILAGYGPGAYWLRLADGDAVWSGPVVAREATDDVLAREASWLRAARAAAVPAPELMTDPPGAVLVFRQPPAGNLTERMVKDLAGIPKLVAGFAQLQARIHRMPVGGLDAAATSAGDPLDELEARCTHPDVRSAVETELDWLRRNRPAERSPVACHGAFNPVHVYLEGSDFSTAVPANWTAARVADAEYDVAGSLTAFWSASLYLENAIYRKAMNMARDPLLSSYQEAYTGAAGPLAQATLNYWQVHHLSVLVADAHRKIHDDLSGPWDMARSLVDPKGAIDDLRARIRDLAAG